MRNRLWSLYLSLLNIQYGISAMRYRLIRERRRRWEPILLAVVLVPFAVGLMKFFWHMTEALFVAGLGFGQPHLALVYGAAITSVLTLFFGFFSVLSAFYFSTDLELLVPMPLKSWEILLIKLAVVLTGKYALNFLILAPIWLKYGLLAKPGPGYILSAPFVFLLLPLLPLLAVSLVMVVLMRFVNFSRHRDKLTFIGGLLAVAFSVGIQLWVRSRTGSGDFDTFVQQILTQTDGLVHIVGRVFPSATWAAQAMAYAHRAKGWLNLLLLAAVGALGLGVLLAIGERVFLRSVLHGLERGGGGSGRKKTLENIKSRPVLASLAFTELKVFLRDPNYALNGLVGYVMFPFLAGFSFFTQDLPGNPLEVLSQLEIPSYMVLAGTALYFTAMVSMSLIPSTTFSREGKHLWVMRSLPVRIEQVVCARVLAAAAVNLVGCSIGVLPIAYLVNLQWNSVLWGMLFGLLLSAAWSGLLVLWDLRRPMLDWVNPVRAVKSNLNAMVGLAFTLVFVVLLGVLIFSLQHSGRSWLAPLILALAVCGVGAANYYALTRFGGKLWMQIEGGM